MIQKELPKNLEVVTLEAWDVSTLLLRVAHQFGLDEDPGGQVLSKSCCGSRDGHGAAHLVPAPRPHGRFAASLMAFCRSRLSCYGNTCVLPGSRRPGLKNLGTLACMH